MVSQFLVANPLRKIDEESDGCRITTHFDISPFTKVFMTFWLCGAVVCAGGALMGIFLGRTNHTIEEICFALCFPLVGILLPRLGQLIGKIDEAKLLGLLESVKKLSIGINPTE
jgi:hypothetical protein